MGRLLRQVVKKFGQLESRNLRSKDRPFSKPIWIPPTFLSTCVYDRNPYPPKHFGAYMHNWNVNGLSQMRRSEVSMSIVKRIRVKCCRDVLSNKVSNIIRGHIDNIKLLLICNLLLSHSFIFFRLFFISVYMVVLLFNTVIYVFLLLCLRILIVCLRIFIVPAGTLRLPWMRFFRASSSVVRQMPG
jgi:hypothetical protein